MLAAGVLVELELEELDEPESEVELEELEELAAGVLAGASEPVDLPRESFL